MLPEELHLRVIRFESRSGSSEGRLTYDSSQMRNIGARPDDLDPAEYEEEVPAGPGFVRYTRTTLGWVATFHEPE